MKNEMWYTKAKKMFRSRKITMQQLGDEMGLHKSTICLKLNGKVDCDSGELMAIASILDITIDQLLANDPRYAEHSKNKMQANLFINGYAQLNDEQKQTISDWLGRIEDEKENEDREKIKVIEQRKKNSDEINELKRVHNAEMQKLKNKQTKLARR